MLIFFLLLILVGCQGEQPDPDWETYKADRTSSSYSALDQINTENVDQLEVAWTYRTGDLDPKNHPGSGIETNPIVVDDVMYGVSPHLKVFAVDATTGEEQWQFDPLKDEEAGGRQRAVVYWEDEERTDQRIFFSAETDLYALKANTGTLITEFGDEGRVDMNEGLGRDPDSISVRASSPGIVYEDLLIMGSSVGEGRDAPPGDIRAYDVKTGERVWTFHTIPQPGDPAADTWHIDAESLREQGGANNWAGMSLDHERGLVYVPTGSAVYDFYGGHRPGKNLYANTLLALDAETGKHIWHFQTVHHDLWDYDLPAPPNLVTVERKGDDIAAVVQVTKQGFTFVFDRETGNPVFPIEERPVPASRIDGEEAWPTQPIPTAPEPFARQHFSQDEVTNVSRAARDYVLRELATYRNEGLYTPPDPTGTVTLPSTRGAANWGGAAHDRNGILYVNATELPGISTVRKIGGTARTEGDILTRGRNFYVQNCASCHGMNREGQPPMLPSLTNLQERRSKQDVLRIIEKGGSQMPAFPSISEEKKEALIAFLFEKERSSVQQHRLQAEPSEREGGQYVDTTAHKRFRDPNGHPAIKPPWGTLNAIDLNTGEMKWQVPLGTEPELADRKLSPTGLPSIGGPIVTAGGLLFIAGTKEKKFRAYDKDTGELLWQTTLPAGAFSTPSTYKSNGRQYVVIAAGGGRGTEPGDYYVAFALPE